MKHIRRPEPEPDPKPRVDARAAMRIRARIRARRLANAEELVRLDRDAPAVLGGRPQA